MPRIEPVGDTKEKAVAKSKTVARKVVLAFSAMFVIPMLLTIYLFTGYAGVSAWDRPRLNLLVISVTVLGMGGLFVCRSVVHALLRASREASAIAAGDITRRMATNTDGEISELAKNFNRITHRLQQTVDMKDMFDMFLGTLLSLTGLEIGAIFLLSPDGKILTIQASAGISAELEATTIPVGRGVVGWVASHGQLVTTSESMPWREPGGLTEIEKAMPWAIHVPLGVPGRTRGVMSLGLREGNREITGDDMAMIQNLATQIAVAIENDELRDRMENTYVEVTELSVAIARRMEIDEESVKDLEAAALLHDIGKIGIPDHILHHSGMLSLENIRHIHNHPIEGENILKPVGSLARLCPIVRHHHEQYDGGGYPDRLKGREIPLAARILAVADSFDAMLSDRAYKRSQTMEEILPELVKCKGTQFDPECVDVLLAHLTENPETGTFSSP
jgi:HD-GYP domain-containing protein (c-di-GMP phosphodiesterase class II)/HAMP domain-containing protein